MDISSIPTILSIVFGLITLLLGAALSALVYFGLQSLRTITSDLQSIRSELAAGTNQLRKEARQDRDEQRAGLRRVHERIDEIPQRYVCREDCILAQNRLTAAVTRLDDKVSGILKALKLSPQPGG